MVSVSVIVPTYNEERYLPLLLESLRRQTSPPAEIIVADAKSEDETQNTAYKYGATVLSEKGLPEFPSCNKAANIAKSDILIFTGADAIFPRNAIEKISQVMVEKNLESAYCPVYPYDAPAWGRIEFRLWYAATFAWFHITGEANACTAFFAIRRRAFEASGGFLDVYGGDSVYSRLLAKKYRIRPIQSLKIPISGRKMQKMGFREFNAHQITVLLDVFFWFMRSGTYLRKLKHQLHTDDYQTIR